MTASDPKFDAELAWDIQEWVADWIDDEEKFCRDEVKQLATFLTEKGYHKGATGLKASVEYVEKAAKYLSEEFAPIYDILVKNQKTEG